MICTLRIEHEIHDFDQWRAAFDRFTAARVEAGVRGFVIRRPSDDPHHLMLDLEFDSAADAAAFARFLEERVWSDPAASPALAGVPRTRVLDVLDSSVGSEH